MHASLVASTGPRAADVFDDPRYHPFARGRIAMAKAVAKLAAEQIDQLTTEALRSQLQEIVMHLEQVVPSLRSTA